MIAIGCDHGGYDLKLAVESYLKEQGVEYVDFGCDGEKVVNGECDKGILVCGTGIGMSMCANKINGIRAAVCGDTFSAKYTRLHNNANVLCMGGRVIGAGLACEIVHEFLTNEFEGGRHIARLDKMKNLEGK